VKGPSGYVFMQLKQHTDIMTLLFMAMCYRITYNHFLVFNVL